MRVGSILMLAGGLLVSTAASAAVPVYDAVADFSTTSATGLWNYGFGTLGTSFTAATVGGNCATDLFCWQPNATTLGTPLIGINTSGAALTFPTGWIPTGVLDLHPGPSAAEDAIVRFIAPTAGSYRFAGTFGLIGYDATGTTVAAFGPAGQLFSATLANASPGFGAFGSAYNFLGTVTLAAGEAVDFGVNNGGSFFGDSTVMSLSITPGVPEPGNWALLILGFGAIGSAMRHRRGVVAA